MKLLKPLHIKITRLFFKDYLKSIVNCVRVTALVDSLYLSALCIGMSKTAIFGLLGGVHHYDR